jgi:cell division protein FtsB
VRAWQLRKRNSGGIKDSKLLKVLAKQSKKLAKEAKALKADIEKLKEDAKPTK